MPSFGRGRTAPSIARTSRSHRLSGTMAHFDLTPEHYANQPGSPLCSLAWHLVAFCSLPADLSLPARSDACSVNSQSPQGRGRSCLGTTCTPHPIALLQTDLPYYISKLKARQDREQPQAQGNCRPVSCRLARPLAILQFLYPQISLA